MSKFKKPVPFVPKKRYAPRPVSSSTTTTTISVESLVEDDEEYTTEPIEQITCQNGPWFMSFKALVWINFVLTLVLMIVFVIYVVGVEHHPGCGVRKSGEKVNSHPPKGGGNLLSFNLVPHVDSKERWAIISIKSLGIDISTLKSVWVCCTKDNIYSCGFDASILVESMEAKIAIKHPEKIGSVCYLHLTNL